MKSEKKIQALVGAIAVTVGLVAFSESELWQRLFYPSTIALPFDPSIDTAKVAFMAQQPYQGYYGAWVQFGAAILTVAAALGTIAALVMQTRAVSKASFKAIRAEDRRHELEMLSKRAGIMAACTLELQTLATDYRAALLQFRAERAASDRNIAVPMGVYNYDVPRAFDLSASDLAALGPNGAAAIVKLRQNHNLLQATQNHLKRRSDELDIVLRNGTMQPHHFEAKRRAWAPFLFNAQSASDEIRHVIEYFSRELRAAREVQDRLVAEAEETRKRAL